MKEINVIIELKCRMIISYTRLCEFDVHLRHTYFNINYINKIIFFSCVFH
jgi:hypothetical protein